MKNILLVLMAIASFQVQAKEIYYVGDGRYTCKGDDCSGFNREQKQYNARREDLERYRREEREENQNIENQLRRTNEILEEE
ncbi:hypothetical protein UFOVP26_129 [uncultured Caudovirales phage]|uniref:Uncharacterized protein n=1 Tax=uncultured Caudovirales phage TaxID=2100421 RepID=A0A6J5KSE2_9CAUD|nr:hypothetical protein UFOVP26_129 [uncultured Caudovirales phage]CAB4123973.1 hypothetical protein UFOVP44_106 [uncultured Caudovirales phage]CAB5219544.1 hypothetical protein UFOVP220_97 [uncultured Caudovirales phage]